MPDQPRGTTFASGKLSKASLADMRLAYENATEAAVKPNFVFFADTPASREILKHYGVPIPKSWKRGAARKKKKPRPGGY